MHDIGDGPSFPADFSTADDLLWQARADRLRDHGRIRIKRSGLVGPLVEMTFARRALPDAYSLVHFEPALVPQIDQALEDGAISGAADKDIAGIFPLSQHDPDGPDQSLWEQWAKHAENAAVANGIERGLAQGLVGAIIELQMNVYNHSGSAESGLIAYGVRPGSLEFVVADAGRGVLASLRENPEFSGLTDHGEALRVAMSDGASRFGRTTGRGYGISQLFRALARDYGELRFSSGDHTLTLWGDGPSLTGQFKIAHKAHLAGFCVSVSVQAPNRSTGGR